MMSLPSNSLSSMNNNKPISKVLIIDGVAVETKWMIQQRMEKFRQGLHDTMSLSPFLIPILFDLHHADNFSDLAELLMAGHLMIGHFTSFGKLIDEKILPKVFNTFKLSGKYRESNPPLALSCFNEIDHLVPRGNKFALLSLKASRWTINLSVAKELNSAFSIILRDYIELYNEIVVGVFNGTLEGLTDKYDILRGINRGKTHDVLDIQTNVKVVAGRDFWSWLNFGETQTQDWVLEGILKGLKQANCREESRTLLRAYISAFNERYAKHIKADGSIDWQQLLAEING
ncbi:MAG: restriction endonuclease [Anaerolineae bacterium]